MSSAEDKTSSTVLPSQGSSNSAPEEFPVDSQQEHASSSATPAGEPPQVELKTNASPQQSPEEPGDDTGIPLKTKPLPRVNAIAREVQVRVTGAKAGSVPEERDLFSELTATVLVFEKGGVIRLTAAVIPGQLLFLRNEESSREVVTQVIRKRAHRPTECYVELEFTERAPGFWGTEFSAATALLPKDAKLIAAAEMISSSETTEDELGEAAPPPSAAEVEALKREVEALRSQLSQIQTQPEPAKVEPAGAIPEPPSIPPLDAHPPQTETPIYQSERASWTELSADVSPPEVEPKPSRVYAPEQDLLPKPALNFHVPVPKRKRSFQARGQFTPGFRTGILRLAILSGVLAALIGFVWYKHWLPWMPGSGKFSVSTWAGGVTTKVSAAETSAPRPASLATQPTKAGTGVNEPLSAKGAFPSASSSSKTPAEVTAGNEKEMAPYEVVPKPAAKEKSKPAASIAVTPSPVPSLPAKTINSVPASTGNSNIVPPKLIKSEKAIATLQDLRDFETGDVVVDAIIDTAGNVTSMRALSGPPSLRWPALQAFKNYKYEPATQNGKPVPTHVTVKIQFHFE